MTLSVVARLMNRGVNRGKTIDEPGCVRRKTTVNRAVNGGITIKDPRCNHLEFVNEALFSLVPGTRNL